MITQPKETMPEQKPMIPNQPPKPAPPRAAPSAPALGTSIHSNGAPDSFNLGGTPGGDCIGCGPGGGPGGGSYEGAVAADIEAALVANPVTRYASAGLRVRIWVNANGVVQRVALAASSGSPAVDTAIVNQILPGMTLPQPPAGTPMPMLVSLTGEQQAQ
jgi:TonB family protein